MTDLSSLAASLSDTKSDAPPPVERWHPEHCGEMDLVIRSDGSWWHEGTRMTRAPLVRLFSRILRKDPGGYVLVTPVEMVEIEVEDVPFLAVDYDRTGDGVVFRTNVGDRVLLSEEHPLTLRRSDALGQDALYLHVRGGLEARIDRSAYYRLAQEHLQEDSGELRIESAGAAFRIPAGEA